MLNAGSGERFLRQRQNRGRAAIYARVQMPRLAKRASARQVATLILRTGIHQLAEVLVQFARPLIFAAGKGLTPEAMIGKSKV